MKKKFFTVCLASVLALGTLSAYGCGKKSVDTPDHLEITVYEAGYGTEALRAVADRYMELNEGKTIEIDNNTDGAFLRTKLPSGPSVNTTDIYFAGSYFFDLLTLGEFKVDGVTYENRFLPLDDVYNSPATGETKPIKEKMFGEYVDYFYCDDEFKSKYNLKNSYYMAPWMGGLNGFVYNSKMFENYGWNVPVTTDEMISLCNAILATDAKSTNKNSMGESIKISPLIFCKADSYWEYVYIEWWAQYDGINTFNNFFEGKNKDGLYLADLAASPGMLETLRVVDSLLGTYNEDGSKRDKIYSDPSLATRTYIDVQATLLNGEGARKNELGATTAAMMPIGDWIENEMYKNYGSQLASGEIKFEMMKTPIISALADKLSFKNESKTERDAKLSQLVKWIDGGKQGTAPAFATEDDIEKVTTARGITASGGGVSHVIVAPAYTSSPDLVKDFIKFFYSDEAIEIFCKTGRGLNLPLEFDYSEIEGISAFQQSKFKILEKSTYRLKRSQKHPITYRAGLKPFSNIASMGSIESNFNTSSFTDYKSPETVFTLNYQEVARVWDRMMEDAGLN